MDQTWPWADSFSSLHRDAYTEVRTPRPPIFTLGCFRACRARVYHSLAKRKVEQGVRLYNQHKQQQAIKKWKSALKAIRKRDDKFEVLGYLYQAYMDWGKYRLAIGRSITKFTACAFSEMPWNLLINNYLYQKNLTIQICEQNHI
ncbi:hypothetical protein PPYR_02795 [Photinus pyralis]|uniref:Rapsyn myristoylation/linker region N-terminal domain-containing protein n=1 Tax=Photinus pyralis TaxID=7054 RepID=A0A5N4A0Z0_PHOPY|nr:hypothetical protein PPYR_02795 [Photinus pyralis]